MPYAPPRLPAASVASAALLAGALAACSRAPEEQVPSGSAAPRPALPALEPLAYDAPAAWAKLSGPTSGPRKAGFRVPRAGSDKEDAEAAVLFFGTGALGDVEKNFDALLADFDGAAATKKAAAERESFESPAGHRVEVIKYSGKFQKALGPKVGPKKQPAISQVKEGFRVVAAAVRTEGRGNWFFSVIGPEATVRAAEPALREMVEKAR